MNKHSVVYSYNGTFCNKKELTTDKHSDMDESQKY